MDAILRHSRTHKLHVKKQEATAAAAAALAAELEKRAGPTERGLQKLRKKSQESKEARREKVTTVKKPAAEKKSTTGGKETAVYKLLKICFRLFASKPDLRCNDEKLQQTIQQSGWCPIICI